MKIYLILIGTFFILLQNGLTQTGDPKSWAKEVIAHRLNMNPKTEFEKWNADQWTNAATICAFMAKIEIPKEIKRLPNLKDGSFRLPENEEAFCKALSKGPTPKCFYLRATTPPFQTFRSGLPRDYVYMEKLVHEGTMVTVGGECNLVANDFSTKQFFTGKAKVIWRSKPKLQSIQTSKGSVQLIVGNIWFDVEGMPEKDNLPTELAVVTNSP
jgi:hypothetical protein